MKSKSQDKKTIAEKAKNIKLLILDVDGVMTDGGIILDNKGNEFKIFHVRDGHGIKILGKVGIKTGIITGRRSKVVAIRAKELGITDVFQKVYKKSEVYNKILKKYNYKDEDVAFMGDDIVDADLLKRAGLSAAPADADDEAKKYADIVMKKDGGRGAVRELTDLILRSSGLWQKASGESLV